MLGMPQNVSRKIKSEKRGVNLTGCTAGLIDIEFFIKLLFRMIADKNLR